MHTTVEPAGTTTVCEFGGGEESLLLNEMQPVRVSRGSNVSERAKNLNLAMTISRSGRAGADAGVRNLAFPYPEYR
ncbi:UNVERIFIED_ORG: hypothetical protein BDU10_3984 [Burkholderia sp. CF145]|nr:hypothetical protein PMI06_008207 [Burkholderia sp. BT03]SKC73332.1 hypothetical protein SAMN06266956_2510 [Paraburkholderia hospita]